MKCKSNGGKVTGAFLMPVIRYKKRDYIRGNEYNGTVELYDFYGNLVNTVKRTKNGFRKI